MEVCCFIQENVLVIVVIINVWIDEMLWMECDVFFEEIEVMIGKGLLYCEMWVLGDFVEVYLFCEVEVNYIWGFYCVMLGQGYGKWLMNKVKEGCDFLSLNMYVFNIGV